MCLKVLPALRFEDPIKQIRSQSVAVCETQEKYHDDKASGFGNTKQAEMCCDHFLRRILTLLWFALEAL